MIGVYLQTRLSSTLYDWLIGSLQSITPKRSSILRIMTFCMDNASCAEHIVEILRDSICDTVPYMDLFYEEMEDGQPKREVVLCQPTVRLARLYVINDLLYNADNGCTTSYRSLIQVQLMGRSISLQNELPLMFEAIARMRNGIENSMIKKEIQIRVNEIMSNDRQIEKMLNGWITNSLLSINFLKGLQVTFLMVYEFTSCNVDE